MKFWGVPGLILLSLVGCGLGVPPTKALYGPVEAGLVLGYENPSRPQEQRVNGRVQLRVDATSLVNGGLDVQTTLTSLQAQTTQRLFLKRGGVAIWDGKEVLMTVLPEGFPQVQVWETKDSISTIVGRSAAEP